MTVGKSRRRARISGLKRGFTLLLKHASEIYLFTAFRVCALPLATWLGCLAGSTGSATPWNKLSNAADKNTMDLFFLGFARTCQNAGSLFGRTCAHGCRGFGLYRPFHEFVKATTCHDTETVHNATQSDLQCTLLPASHDGSCMTISDTYSNPLTH